MSGEAPTKLRGGQVPEASQTETEIAMEILKLWSEGGKVSAKIRHKRKGKKERWNHDYQTSGVYVRIECLFHTTKPSAGPERRAGKNFGQELVVKNWQERKAQELGREMKKKHPITSVCGRLCA